MILFQIDHRACQRIGIVSFPPVFIAFTLAGTQDISEFACAIQRNGAKDNVVMERCSSRGIFHFNPTSSKM